MKSVPLILLGVGILLVVLSALWPLIFPASRSWTEEKSTRMTELGNEAHKLLFQAIQAKERPQPGGPSPREAQDKYDAAKAELDALKAEFEAVRDSPKNSGTYLRWTGIVMVLLGGGAVLTGRGG